MNVLGENLKRLREDKELTQRELAKLSGINHSTISLLEAGRRPSPSIEVLNGLSEGLDIDFYKLLEELGIRVYNKTSDLIVEEDL